MYKKEFQISQTYARGLCGELCSWIHQWIWLDSCRWDRFFLSTARSFYDTYEITYLNFVSIFCHLFGFCFLAWQSPADRNRMFWPLFRMIWILELSHGAFDPCTCTDKLSCLTIWTQTSRKSWHTAKLVNKLLFTKIWRQKSQFAYLLHCRLNNHRHVLVRIWNLYGE